MIPIGLSSPEGTAKIVYIQLVDGMTRRDAVGTHKVLCRLPAPL